jgi:hypothetical protein
MKSLLVPLTVTMTFGLTMGLWFLGADSAKAVTISLNPIADTYINNTLNQLVYNFSSIGIPITLSTVLGVTGRISIDWSSFNPQTIRPNPNQLAPGGQSKILVQIEGYGSKGRLPLASFSGTDPSTLTTSNVDLFSVEETFDDGVDPQAVPEPSSWLSSLALGLGSFGLRPRYLA